MSSIYKVLEHLQLLWMGIWPLTQTDTTTDITPDVGGLAENLGDASLQIMSLVHHKPKYGDPEMEVL